MIEVFFKEDYSVGSMWYKLKEQGPHLCLKSHLFLCDQKFFLSRVLHQCGPSPQTCSTQLHLLHRRTVTLLSFPDVTAHKAASPQRAPEMQSRGGGDIREKGFSPTSKFYLC